MRIETPMAFEDAPLIFEEVLNRKLYQIYRYETQMQLYINRTCVQVLDRRGCKMKGYGNTHIDPNMQKTFLSEVLNWI